MMKLTIHEAAMLAAKGKEKAIRRSGWPEGMAIIPTDTPECCVATVVVAGKRMLHPRWEPQAADLIATDWRVITVKGVVL